MGVELHFPETHYVFQQLVHFFSGLFGLYLDRIAEERQETFGEKTEGNWPSVGFEPRSLSSTVSRNKSLKRI